MVVRPIVTYAATALWPIVKFKTSKVETSKLQRMDCLAITEATKTTPTAANEVLIGLPHSTCSWRLIRPEQVFIDSTAVIN